MTDEINELRQISVDLIDDPESPVRTRANEGALNELADSIRAVGLIQPLLVRPKNNRFEVVAGHRRLVAAKLAGLLTVHCIVCRVGDLKADTIKLHENLMREDVNIVDQARLIKRVMEEKKLSVVDVAKSLKRSETFIRDRIDLFKWDPAIVGAVEAGRISFTSAKWFAKITDNAVRKHYLDVGIRQGISAALARDWFKRWEARGLPTPPPPEEKTGTEIESHVEYYNEPCRVCGQPIAMGEEKLIFVHPKCWEDLEKAATREDLKEIQQ